MNCFLQNFISLLIGLVCLTSAAITPSSSKFNSTADAISFRGASDKSDLANVVFLHRTHKQRVFLANKYQRMYGEQLFPYPSAWKVYLNIQEYDYLLYTMARPMLDTYIDQMYSENKPSIGWRYALFDAVATFSNNRWKYVREHAGDKHLFTDYVKSNWAHFDVMFDDIKAGKRNESQKADAVAAKKDAKFLHNIVGTGFRGDDWVKDEHDLRDFFVNRSFEQILQVYLQYKALYPTNLDHDIDNYMFEDIFVKSAILAILRVRVNAPYYFAERLHEAMSGAATNEEVLTRIIVSRSEIDMADIKKAYQSQYGESLASAIESDTSRNYKDLLLAIIA